MGRRTPRGGGASTSGLVLCEEDSMPDGCFHYKRGTLTDPLKRENDARTMDPDVAMMRNDALVEKLREEDANRRKPISRDVEDMRRLRQKLKSFDAAERKEREERRARLTRKKNRISGFVDARVGSASGVPRPPRDSIPVRAVDGFIFGQLALAVYAFRKTRAPFVASLAALAFAGTARAFFTENWRIVVLSGIFGAFFGILRGAFIIVVLSLLGTMTALTEEEAWVNAKTRAYLEFSVIQTIPYLPESVVDKIKIKIDFEGDLN